MNKKILGTASFVIILLVLITFQNQDVFAETVNVNVINADPNFVRIYVELPTYTTSDGLISVEIRDSSGNYLKQTTLLVKPKPNSGIYGAEMSFIPKSSGTTFEIRVSSELGGYIGSTTFSIRIVSHAPIVDNDSAFYHPTNLELEIRYGIAPNTIQIKPFLTTDTNASLDTDSIKISINGQYVNKILSNQWSSNYSVSGKTVKVSASVGNLELSDGTLYRGDSATKTFSLSANNGIIVPQPRESSDSGAIFGYVIFLIIIIIIIVVVVILLKKRKKAKSLSIHTRSIIQNTEKTHFWGCPHCGGDTQQYYGKQYCKNCKVYLN